MAKKGTKPSEIEELLGPRLLTKVGSAPVSTSSVIKGKDIVLLYFSASWCPPCKAFTPVLVDFYNSAKANGVQVIFVSSDRDLPSFEGYFGKMPWAALPTDGETAKIKQRLAERFQIQGIPALVAIDAKTGKYITDDGRNEVMGVSGDSTKAKELVQTWKAKEAVPIEEAVFTHGQQPFGVASIISFLLRNPIYIFGLLYFAKKGLNFFSEMGKDEEKEL